MPSADHTHSTTRQSPPADAPVDFRDLERRLNAARADHDKTVTDKASDEAWAGVSECMRLILGTPPRSLSDAIVKLRFSCDPDIGMEAGGRDDEPESIRQVLARLEHVVGGGGGDLLAALAAEMAAAIDAHNSYDVHGSRHDAPAADSLMDKHQDRIDALELATLAIWPASLTDCLIQARVIASFTRSSVVEIDPGTMRLIGIAMVGISHFLERCLGVGRDQLGGRYWMGGGGEDEETTSVTTAEPAPAAVAQQAATAPADAEIIIDIEEAEALKCLDCEPVLGPLAREIYEIEEKQGNLIGGSANPAWGPLEERWTPLYATIKGCHAETIGGVAWRLADLLRVLKTEDVSAWMVETATMAFKDAAALHRKSCPTALSEAPAGPVVDNAAEPPPPARGQDRHKARRAPRQKAA